MTLEIRPRQAWEAVDLGLLMAKRWWLPMTTVWLLVSLPCVMLTLLLPVNKLWIGALLVWWLTPVFERPLLHILSHAIFNASPDTRATLKAFPALALPQLFASLTWRRFSPSRSMDLPVLQLEKLYGKRRQERLTILHREDSSAAGWITFLGFALEVFLCFGLMLLIWAMIPRELNLAWSDIFLDRDSALFQYMNLLLWYIAITLVTPFYVACGFALYLNRRIKLEAWDIDIAFRRILNKRTSGQTSAPSIAGAMVFALLIGLVTLDMQRPAYAQENLLSQVETQAADTVVESTNHVDLSRMQAKKSIADVVNQPEFNRKKITRYPAFFEPNPDEKYPVLDRLIKFLRNFTGFSMAATGLEFVLWGLVIALILWVTFRYRHWLAAQWVRVGTPPATKAKPVTLFGMDVTQESLPADVSTAALALLQQGETRAALALLYRASLFHLINSGLEIQDGHTETECVELMREHFTQTSAMQARVTYFARLTQHWQRLAYGHLEPAGAEAQQLCAQWNACWVDSKGTGQ